MASQYVSSIRVLPPLQQAVVSKILQCSSQSSPNLQVASTSLSCCCIPTSLTSKRRHGHAIRKTLPPTRAWFAHRMLVRCSIAVESGATAEIISQGATEDDARYMRMCLELAKEAIGKTTPNPMVGCVIVKDGKIVGRGFHPKAGEPHAEVFALKEAGILAEGATVYVSLEPCNHHGRTPPCSQALVKAKVKRVVVGIVDPNPQVAGKGVKTLRDAGIEVVVGVEETLCHATNEVFMHRMVTGQPFVTLRYSISMDGGFLGNAGVNTAKGSVYSKLLQENDAVIITDAAVYDDPHLLSSEPGAKQPLRVILSRTLDLPLESRVFDTRSAKTLVLVDLKTSADDAQIDYSEGKLMEDRLQAQGVDVVRMKDLELDHVLSVCYHRGACSVLLDSRGPQFSGLENFLGQQALREQVAQKVIVHVAPIFLGENRTEPGFRMENDLVKLERVSSYTTCHDVVIQGYFPVIYACAQ